MTLFQRSFLYKPAPAWLAPAEHGLPQAEALSLAAADGTTLRGWYLRPTRADAPVYLYFHGNANGLDRRATRFGYLAREGAGVFALSYRGYGGSGGHPSEAALHADARLAYDAVRKEIPANHIVIFGESLGTGVALHLARQVEAKAIILDSPYLSVLDRGQASYPWLPVSWLLTDTFRSDLWIGEARAPVFIFHGTADAVIPHEDSARLAARGKPGQVSRKLYPGKPHVVPLNEGPMPDIEAFLAQ